MTLHYVRCAIPTEFVVLKDIEGCGVSTLPVKIIFE